MEPDAKPADVILEQHSEQQIEIIKTSENNAQDQEKPTEINIKSAEPMKIQEEHLIEMHIDIRSVKNMTIPANLVIEYNVPISENLNFRSPIPINIPKNTEIKLQGTFAHHKFKITQDILQEKLSTNNLTINLFNFHDNLSVLLGTSDIQLAELLGPKASIQKTSKSVIRVLDLLVPILAEDENEIGKLRVILYLEDHGIASQNSAQINEKQTKTEQKPMILTTKKEISTEKNEEEMMQQILLWKKAEEAKFKSMLKQKEQETLDAITEEWRNKEIVRTNEFSIAIDSIHEIESKLKTKSKELSKREQQIVKIEDSLKAKIIEITSQLAQKEEEIISVKTHCKDEKTQLEKDKKALQVQMENTKKQISEIEQKYKDLRKEYEESPINQLKNEINLKQANIIELERKLEKSMQTKEQYRQNYEKIKAELIKIRNEMDLEKERNIEKQKEEIEKLRIQIASQKYAEEEQKEMKNIKSQLENLQKEYATKTPIKQEEFQLITTNRLLETKQAVQPLPSSQIERLINERKELIMSGLYTENDEVVRVLTNQIEAAQKIQE